MPSSRRKKPKKGASETAADGTEVDAENEILPESSRGEVAEEEQVEAGVRAAAEDSLSNVKAEVDDNSQEPNETEAVPLKADDEISASERKVVAPEEREAASTHEATSPEAKLDDIQSEVIDELGSTGATAIMKEDAPTGGSDGVNSGKNNSQDSSTIDEAVSQTASKANALQSEVISETRLLETNAAITKDANTTGTDDASVEKNDSHDLSSAEKAASPNASKEPSEQQASNAIKAPSENVAEGSKKQSGVELPSEDVAKGKEFDVSVCLDVDAEIFRMNRSKIVRAILRNLFARIAQRPEGVAAPSEEEVLEVKVEKPALPPMESMVWLELKKGVLTINPDATDVFAQCSGYVNPVMISGKLRTGKSYLMNALSDSQAFGVSSQARSFTQGVHVCDRLAPCTQFGGPEDGPQLAFLDAEGQADKGKSYDIKMATPLLLVSKVIIMNEICPTGPSKEDILRTLEIMMRAAEQVADRKKRKKLFGNLHVMMRDCSQEEAECWSIVFDQEDPEISETMEQVKAIEERNMIRESIFSSFETEPKVWCLPPLKQYPAPKNYREACPEYVAKIDEIRAFMALQLAQPKLLDDKPLTGTMIAALMPQLQEALKSDSPILNPPSMMQAVCDLEAERIAQAVSHEAEKYFRTDMAKKLPLPSPYYEGEVDCVKAMFAASFKEKLDHLPKDSQEKVFVPFESRLTLMDERLAALNREKLAEKATQEALSRAKELEEEMAMERLRADEARAEVDKILAERDSEKERVAALLKQMEDIDEDRQAERNRIKELEDFINKEASDREAELQRQIEEEQRRVEEAEQALRDEAERQKEAEEEQAKLMEEQRLQMEEMQREIEEERKAREDAERELGLREEERAIEDEAADAAEAAAEAKKEPALIYAVKAADVFAVRGLVRHHPDSLHTRDKNQRTALHFCENEDCAQALIKAKADPNVQDMGLWSPLHNAASKGLFEIAELILGANGNVLLTTKQGNTPLDLAYEQPDMTAMLLSAIPELYNTLELEEEPGAGRRRKNNPTEDEASKDEAEKDEGASPETAEEAEGAVLDGNIGDDSEGNRALKVGNSTEEERGEPQKDEISDAHEEEASEVVIPTDEEGEP